MTRLMNAEQARRERSARIFLIEKRKRSREMRMKEKPLPKMAKKKDIPLFPLAFSVCLRALSNICSCVEFDGRTTFWV